MIDQTFRDAVVDAANTHITELIEHPVPAADLAVTTHRVLMRQAKVLLSAVAAGTAADRDACLALAAERIAALRGQQSETGLFTGGDNLQSPPDSGFTVNDACDAYALLDGAAHEPGIAEVRASIAEIIQDAASPLLHGGVHTPNHRWEIASALARIHRSFPDERLVARAQEWLSEGVDIDADGIYSERSPNYAVYVSNPSLTVLAEVLERDELYDAVVRNLVATLALVHADDTVETVQSRRQDQSQTFPLSNYLPTLRIAAVRSGRGDLAQAAGRAARAGITDPELLAESLLHPDLIEQLPEAAPESTEQRWQVPSVRLAGRRSPRVQSVVYAGSDYADHGRIRSGLANNPTFMRLFAGSAIIDSIRLSRSFFDLGPFRPTSIEQTGESVFVLTEHVEAAYYQPLPESERRADGAYELVDDGRFSASMAFDRRPRDEVSMTTVITATLREDGADLDIAIDAPPLPFSVEFAFRGEGEIDGAQQTDGTWVLPTGAGAFRSSESAITIETAGLEASANPLPYQPGQDYAFLGATDAPAGTRVRLGGIAPARFTVRLRAQEADRR